MKKNYTNSDLKEDKQIFDNEKNNTSIDKINTSLLEMQKNQEKLFKEIFERLKDLENNFEKLNKRVSIIENKNSDKKYEYKGLINEIPFENINNTFDNFKPRTEQHQLALEKLNTYLGLINSGEEFSSTGIFIEGKAGTGKTHLAIAFSKLVKKDKKFLFISPKDIFKKITTNLVSLENKKKFLDSLDVIILDDFNGENGGHEIDLIQEIIPSAADLGSKIILITSNCSYEDFVKRNMPKFGDGERFEVHPANRCVRQTR